MTLKEIAEKAGVSIATVSYALNNSAPVKPKTKERILKIAQEFKYNSNAIARSLRVNKTNTIGILAEDLTVSMTGRIIDGINAHTEQMGYNTILSNLRLLSKVQTRFSNVFHYQSEIQSVLENFLSLQVDGIIYIGIHDRNVDGLVTKSNKPLAYCYCYTTDPEDLCVTYDNFNISGQITREFIQNGHTRIGLITGTLDSTPSQQRMMGFQQALMEANLPFNLDYVKNGNWDFLQGQEAARQLLTMVPRPTAIYAMNDEMAMGVFYVAEDLGLSIPNDLSVAGFDHASFIRYQRPKLTTVQSPLFEMGNQTAKLLLETIDGDKENKGLVCFPCQLIQGESIAPYAG